MYCSHMPPAYVDDTHVQEAVDNNITNEVHQPNRSTKSQIIPDSDPPKYSEKPEFQFDTKEEPSPSADTKSDTYQLPPDIPASTLQASIEGAFQVAAENYFKGGAFARAMTDTIHRVSTIQTTHSYNQDTESDDPAVTSSQSSSTTGNQVIHSRKLRRANTGRICRQTSAIGSLFGTIWLRKTSVRVDSSSGKKFDVISSFSFLPSWWLSRLGVMHGIEANLGSTAAGWQFNFDPIRAVQEDAPIFKFCKSGNLAAVQQLIADGSASVKDTSPKGLQPLHVSCVFLSFKLCASASFF